MRVSAIFALLFCALLLCSTLVAQDSRTMILAAGHSGVQLWCVRGDGPEPAFAGDAGGVQIEAVAGPGSGGPPIALQAFGGQLADDLAADKVVHVEHGAAKTAYTK